MNNMHNEQFLLEFNSDEIRIIQEMWFTDFDWSNINIRHSLTGNSILMELVLREHLFWLTENFDPQVNKTLVCKLVLNPIFDINAQNNKWSTILSNLIQLWDGPTFGLILLSRNDISAGYWHSKFGETYIDAAKAFWEFGMVELLEEYLDISDGADTMRSVWSSYLKTGVY